VTGGRLSSSDASVPRASDPAPAGWAERTGRYDLTATTPAAAVDIQDHLAITDVVHRYAWALNHLRADVIETLLAPDASFTGSFAGDREWAVDGAPQIAEFLVGYMREVAIQRRHFVTNLLVQWHGPGSATAIAYFLIVSGESPPGLIATGWYAMDLRKSERWLISSVYDGVDAELPGGEWKDD
jgi:SnoaL-like protein